MKLSASIVIYNENKDTLKKVIESFLTIDLKTELFIVDNSPNDSLKECVESFNNVKYIFSGSNLGFGAGHNLAFKYMSQKSDMHLIINPDTYFIGEDIKDMLTWMSDNKEISLSVPKVISPDGTLQHTVRNIPTIMTLLKRRLNINGIFDDFVRKDEFQDIEFNTVSEIPFAHGCFFIFRTDVYEKLNGFDDRFFMYMEDIDIFIRAREFGKTVINPQYKIYHEHRRGSAQNFKLLMWHISSAVKFFMKH